MAKSTTEKSAELQKVLDRFDALLAERNLDGLLPFLQNDLEGRRTGFKKHLLKTRRHLNAFVEFETEQLRNGRKAKWGTRGDDAQCRIVKLTALAVLDLSDTGNFSDEIPILQLYGTDPIVRAIVDWAKPAWIARPIEESFDKTDWFSFDYRLLRTLETNGILEFSPRLFALSLGKWNRFQYDKKEQELLHFLSTDATVLERDIPLLFDYETRLHDRWTFVIIDDKQVQIWEHLLQKLLTEGKIDRGIFIEKALQVQTKNWNNAVKLFFRKLLQDVNPTVGEWVAQQRTLFSLLHEGFPQVVNFGMDKIKLIHQHPDFELATFLDWLPPVLMRQDAQSSIKKALQMFDTFIRAVPERRLDMLADLADVLVVPNLELQEQAARRILKHGQPGDAALREKLEGYQPQMLGNIRQSFAQLLGETDAGAADAASGTGYQYQPEKYRLLETPVTLPENWNEIMFLVSRYLSGREPLDAEIILNTYQIQRHLFPADFGLQMKPLLKQIGYWDYPAHVEIDNLMNGFLLDDAAFLRNLYAGVETNIPQATVHAPCIFGHLIRLARRNIARKSLLPLLCFPTHRPFWIEPQTLVQRLLDYQAAGEKADLLDLSVAISRMPRERVAEAVSLLPKLKSEHRRLMDFCLGVSAQMYLANEDWPSRLLPFTGKTFKKADEIAVWAVAARTFDHDGFFPEFEKTSLDDVPNVARPFSPRIQFVRHPKREIPAPHWRRDKTDVIPAHTSLSISRPPYKEAPLQLLYSAGLCQNDQQNYWVWSAASENSLTFWHSLIPQNPNPLAWHCILTQSGLKSLLQVIRRPENQWTPPITFAFCMAFYDDNKPTRFQASEVLHLMIEENRLDTTRLGKQLGDFVFFKFGALTRLLECLESAKDVSPKHNAALFEVLDGLFAQFYENAKSAPGEPLPTHFKKLVEHFADLHVKTHLRASARALDCLQLLEENTALKKLIAQIKSVEK